MADDEAEEPTVKNILRVRHIDDGTWSFVVEDVDGNVLHTQDGLASQDEATEAGKRWAAVQEATRQAKEYFARRRSDD